MGNCTAIIVVLTQLEHEHFRNTNAYDFLSKYFDQIIENDFWYNFEDNIFDQSLDNIVNSK